MWKKGREKERKEGEGKKVKAESLERRKGKRRAGREGADRTEGKKKGGKVIMCDVHCTAPLLEYSVKDKETFYHVLASFHDNSAWPRVAREVVFVTSKI